MSEKIGNFNAPLIFSKKMVSHKTFGRAHIQSNLCITTTLGTQSLRPLLTGGRCPEVALCYEN